MLYSLNVYTVLTLVSTLFSGIMMVRGLLNHRTSSIGWFTALMAQIFVWSGAYFFELTSSSFSSVLFWSRIEYFGAPFIAPTWFILVITYTGKLGKTDPSRYYLLYIIPILSALAAWTNDFHFLLWQNPSLLEENLFVTLNFSPGLWYIINIAYSYGLFIIATITLFYSYLTTSPVFRWQILLLLSFSMINWTGNIFYIFRLLPKNFDSSPVIFSISIIPLSFVIFQNSFFSITPIAREVLMDSMTDIFLIIDRFRRVIDFNHEALSFTSFSDIKIRGKAAEEIFPSIIVPEVLDVLDRQGAEEMELPIGDKFYRISITPLHEKDKYLSGYILIMSDITKQKNYARQLEEKNTELEAFSRIVSHDIKTPLNAIIGFSQILMDKHPENYGLKSVDMIKIIHENGEKIESIITEILLLSKTEITDNLVTSPVQMEVIIDTVLSRLSPLITEKKAVIIKPDRWTGINSHGPWIEQIWINYISNAIKYGGSPPVVKLEEQKQGSSIRYLVIDNGRGLLADQKNKLFHPFIRLEESRAEGTGLGLSIVKRMTEKLGGTVGISDPPRGGSVFYFTLPVNR